MPYLKTRQGEVFFKYHPPADNEDATPRKLPVTLLNGHTRTHKDFTLMAKFLNRKNYGVLTLDNRCSGTSQGFKDFTLNDMAKDVTHLWEHLEIERSHLLGISMGGMISQIIANKNPKIVEKLILVSTAPSTDWLQADEGWGHDLQQIQDKMHKYFSENFVEKNHPLIDLMCKQILTQINQDNFVENAAQQRQAMKSFDEVAASIQTKTMIIHGELDQIIPIEAAKELQRKIPNADINIVRGVGHLLLAEWGKQLYNSIEDFFSNAK